MSTSTHSGVPTVSAELHTSITQFYAHHMQLLDSGRVSEWAALFTEDGVFAADGHPEPARGRDAIIAGATHTVKTMSDQGIVRRHWLGMSAITPLEDQVVVRSYAIVYQITEADGVSVRASTTCEDQLVSDGKSSWLIKHRYVSND